MDHCTFLGAGALAADGFSADGNLKVTISNSAIRTSAVLLTPIDAATLPKALDWAGKDNSYALNGVAWVVLPPKGFDSLKGGPTDLKSWTDLFKGDMGGRDLAIKFVGSSTSEGHAIEDYGVITETGQSLVGADPSKVGPGAKP